MIKTKGTIITKSRNYRESRRSSDMYSYFIDNIKDREKLDKHEYLEKVEEFVRDDLRRVSYTQIRKLYATFKREKDYRNAINFVEILMYIAGKSESNRDYKDFLIRLIIPMLKTIETKKQWENFKAFFTSILAFHKFYANN